jgi:hypothetical protein
MRQGDCPTNQTKRIRHSSQLCARFGRLRNTYPSTAQCREMGNRKPGAQANRSLSHIIQTKGVQVKGELGDVPDITLASPLNTPLTSIFELYILQTETLPLNLMKARWVASFQKGHIYASHRHDFPMGKQSSAQDSR